MSKMVQRQRQRKNQAATERLRAVHVRPRWFRRRVDRKVA
jgi:hypothetical protein